MLIQMNLLIGIFQEVCLDFKWLLILLLNSNNVCFCGTLTMAALDYSLKQKWKHLFFSNFLNKNNLM